MMSRKHTDSCLSSHKEPCNSCSAVSAQVKCRNERRDEEEMGTVFVTVGTTRFDLLVRCLAHDSVLQELQRQGFRKLVVQAGASPVPEQLVNHARRLDITADVFPYRDSILDVIQEADLVISHAGAGTTIEVLRAGKRLIVVINESLMDNHQSELADAMSQEQYLLSCTPQQLAETLTRLPTTEFRPFPRQDGSAFRNFLNHSVLRTGNE